MPRFTRASYLPSRLFKITEGLFNGKLCRKDIAMHLSQSWNLTTLVSDANFKRIFPYKCGKILFNEERLSQFFRELSAIDKRQITQFKFILALAKLWVLASITNYPTFLKAQSTIIYRKRYIIVSCI